MSATIIEASIASMNASASGSKNAPDSPPMKNTGVTASMMISVACQIDGRTSSDASRMIRAVDRVLPACLSCRNRRTTFSTSMIASSTTDPSATMKPASTIVFTDAPIQNSTMPAATSDSGIAITLINATRHSYRNAPRIRMTSSAPTSNEIVRFSIDISMNVAGRKILASISIPGSPGLRLSSAASIPCVTSSVLAHGSFSTIIINPAWLLMTAPPISGRVPHLTVATSDSFGASGMRILLSNWLTGMRPSSSGVSTGDG